MAAENRLRPDQLAALAPGGTVTIETSGDFRRPRRSTGTVVRVEARTWWSRPPAPAACPTCTGTAGATASASVAVNAPRW